MQYPCQVRIVLIRYCLANFFSFFHQPPVVCRLRLVSFSLLSQLRRSQVKLLIDFFYRNIFEQWREDKGKKVLLYSSTNFSLTKITLKKTKQKTNIFCPKDEFHVTLNDRLNPGSSRLSHELINHVLAQPAVFMGAWLSHRKRHR